MYWLHHIKYYNLICGPLLTNILVLYFLFIYLIIYSFYLFYVLFLLLLLLLLLQVSEFYQSFRRIRQETPVMLVGIKGAYKVFKGCGLMELFNL